MPRGSTSSAGRRAPARVPAIAPATPGARAARAAPWIAAALALGGALSALVPGGAVRGFDLDAFGRVPVLEGGRVKPIDSVARNALLALRGRQSFGHDGRRVGPDEWLLDVVFRPAVADAQPVFAIDDPEVLGLMALAPGAERAFSARTLAPHLLEVERQAAAARAVEPRLRTRFQGAVLNLVDRVWLYQRLRNTLQPSRSHGLASEIAAARAPGAARRQSTLSELAFFRAVPLPGGAPDGFTTVGEALGAAPADPALAAWAQASAAWAAQDPRAFDRAVAELGRVAEARAPAAARRAALELAFNRAQPFQAGMAVYVLALLALFASWLWKPSTLRPVAFSLLSAGAIVHTAGLAARIVLQGRPPVTNLYSSAVFVGWAAVVLGVVLERIHRRGFGVAVAASAGFASLLVAHHLGASGDTMEMMRAVLDSNFWLATHVVAITIGYGGTFLAGGLGIAYALRRHLAPRADPAAAKALASMIYGVVCFSLFFSFLGTVLGGIWADQSWGRFWGWDPKENGALLIVLWNAIILHARLAGQIRERGLAAMAISGNVVTSLSWFGVNMLGVGLHSYGFMEGAFGVLLAFVASQLAFVAVALAPPRLRRARA
jgi:ABC-type transport system involved in cytochrome c biogenesis permease subunit